MNREIKFRVWNQDNQEFQYFVFSNGGHWSHNIEAYSTNAIKEWQQFTGLKDKFGTDIYEGDELSYKKPYRTTQTHAGDNIPNGSYTEPMEPGIKTIYGEVMFKDGTFYLDTDEDSFGDMVDPISWHHYEWDLEGIKEAISWTRQDADWFDDPEEGDLQYLITDCAKVENAEQLMEYLSGFTIEGHIHDNSELITNK